MAKATTKLNVTKIGTSEFQLYDDYSADKVNKKIDARMRRTGESRRDGHIRQWYTDHEALDDQSKNIWDRSGMKAKHVRYLITLDTITGVQSAERIGVIYKNIFNH